jgi:cardiolipin synthase
MDFRSFYLHFECSVAFYGAGITEKVKDDILTCQKLSHEVTVEETGQTPLYQRLARAFLKLFAPLM